MNIVAFLACACATALAQKSETDRWEFEVASIRPTVATSGFGMRGGPGSSDPETMRATNVSLKDVLEAAYHLQGFQISGPGWLDTERFDIVAKIPPQTTLEQFRVMLQNLLLERFHVKTHREKKGTVAYALVTGRNGSKLRQSDLSVPEAPIQAGSLGKDGFLEVPPGVSDLAGKLSPGHVRITGSRQTIPQLISFLRNRASLGGRPVEDRTGLTGVYDFKLDYAPEGDDARLSARMAASQGTLPDPLGTEGNSAPDFFVAVQEQLGLRLEPIKGSIEVLVIDEATRVPTEN